MTHAGDVTTEYAVENGTPLTVWRHRDFTAIGDRAARFAPPGGEIVTVALSADGNTLVVLSPEEDRKTFWARAYDLQTMALRCAFFTHALRDAACALSADGSLLLMIGYKPELVLEVYNVAERTGVLQRVLWTTDRLPLWFKYAFTSDGKYAVVATPDHGNFDFRELASYEMPRTAAGWGQAEKAMPRHAHATSARRFCISQSGRYVVVCRNDQAAVEWFDTATMQLLHTVAIHDPNRRKMAALYAVTYMTEESDRSVLVVDTATHTIELVDPLEGVKLTSPSWQAPLPMFFGVAINDAFVDLSPGGLKGRDLRTGEDRLRVDCKLALRLAWSPSGKVCIWTREAVFVFDDYLLRAAARLVGVKSASKRRRVAQQ